MRKMIVTTLLLFSTLSQAQKSTEIYIPIGKSPGLSGKQSVIGTIQEVDVQKHWLILSNAEGRHKFMVSKMTKIWLDRSHENRTNTSGTFTDCKIGVVAEVKGLPKTKEFAEWIKLEYKAP